LQADEALIEISRSSEIPHVELYVTELSEANIRIHAAILVRTSTTQFLYNIVTQ
jgi:hypothetical protein